MNFWEIGLIAVGFILVIAFLLFLIRYSNKRVVEITEDIEKKIANLEKQSKKNSKEINELKQIADITSESKEALQPVQREPASKTLAGFARAR